MLTLQQAIEHCEQKSEELRKDADCIECANEHEQLAEWLRELQDYRNAKNSVQKITTTQYKCNLVKIIDNGNKNEKKIEVFGNGGKLTEIQISNARLAGHWERRPSKYTIWQCSNCNNLSDNWTYYCPWCGSDNSHGGTRI